MALTKEDAAKGRAAKAARRAAWTPVRQPHRDDWPYLEAILRRRGLRAIQKAEPASVHRMRQLLRRAGSTQLQAHEAVGMTLDQLIRANPGYPLWWLLATTFEAMGDRPAARPRG